jgi:hypothetical protein
MIGAIEMNRLKRAILPLATTVVFGAALYYHSGWQPSWSGLKSYFQTTANRAPSASYDATVRFILTGTMEKSDPKPWGLGGWFAVTDINEAACTVTYKIDHPDQGVIRVHWTNTIHFRAVSNWRAEPTKGMMAGMTVARRQSR